MAIDKVSRNAEICRLYEAGATLQSIGSNYDLTKERIRQILRGAGIVPRNAPASVPKDIYLGVNLSEDVKAALRVEAERRGLSMSALTSETVTEMLVACGYPLEAEQIANEKV